nr:hypothetical protein [Tanacetum cinerariifolium]
KTFVYDRPRYPVLQMLWGIITSTNVNYAELMWEEFVHAIQTFLTDKANLGSPTKKGRKDKPHVILYCRLTKLIICYLGRTHKIHQRSASSFHLAEEDLRLAEKEGKKKPAIAKQLKSKPVKKKLSKLVPAPKPKVTHVKPSKPSPAKHSQMGKVLKTHKGKSSLQLIGEDESTQPEPEPKPEPKHLELAARVTALEKKLLDLEQKSQTLDNTTWNFGSMVFTLELRDLPHKINQTVNEVVKEAVHIAF